MTTEQIEAVMQDYSQRIHPDPSTVIPEEKALLDAASKSAEFQRYVKTLVVGVLTGGPLRVIGVIEMSLYLGYLMHKAEVETAQLQGLVN